MSSFGSLNIAYTGLNAHQKRINVIGENIANVNTEGYHRQRVDLEPINNLARGLIAGVTRQGGGVAVSDISRLRDETLSDHASSQGGKAAARSKAAEALTQIEQTIGGLTPGGLHDQMKALFNSFDDLASAPEDPAMRRVVLQRAEDLAQGLVRTADSIGAIRSRVEASATETIRVINSLTDQIATIDAEILGANAVDADPNALMDRRDLMIRKVSDLVSIDVVRQSDGQVTISLEGQLMVSNGKSTEISLANSPDAGLATLGYDKISVVAPSGRELAVTSGSLAGDLNALATLIPDARRDLDNVATEVANQINTIHRTGVGLDGSTGLDLFTVIPINGGLEVSTDVADQPDKIGAAAAGAGLLDNEVARTLGQLADAADSPLVKFVEAVGALGVKVAAATSSADAARAASAQADSLALAAGGVSLDEELTDLITAQRSYEASARLLTAMDEMLQTLLATGRVGR